MSNDELVSIGTFKNKHGELFVLLNMRYGKELWITGDETAWEPTKLDDLFILSVEERASVNKLLEGLS